MRKPISPPGFVATSTCRSICLLVDLLCSRSIDVPIQAVKHTRWIDPRFLQFPYPLDFGMVFNATHYHNSIFERQRTTIRKLHTGILSTSEHQGCQCKQVRKYCTSRIYISCLPHFLIFKRKPKLENARSEIADWLEREGLDTGLAAGLVQEVESLAGLAKSDSVRMQQPSILTCMITP